MMWAIMRMAVGAALFGVVAALCGAAFGATFDLATVAAVLAGSFVSDVWFEIMDDRR